MEGPLLPEGSGGEEPPEWPRDPDEEAAMTYNARMWLFERNITDSSGHSVRRKRRAFSDYTAKNCEEAWGGVRPKT